MLYKKHLQQKPTTQDPGRKTLLEKPSRKRSRTPIARYTNIQSRSHLILQKTPSIYGKIHLKYRLLLPYVITVVKSLRMLLQKSVADTTRSARMGLLLCRLDKIKFKITPKTRMHNKNQRSYMHWNANLLRLIMRPLPLIQEEEI